MSTSSRPRYHHGSLKAALLDAADGLLDEGGTGAVSLREVARRAGVSATASYRHFASKEDLLVALATRGFDEFGAAIQVASQTPDHPLTAMGVAYVRFAVAHPGLFRLMFGPAIGNRAQHPMLREAANRTFQQLAAVIDAPGEATAGPRMSATGAWALVHGLATLILDGMLAADDVEGLVRSVLAASR